MAILGQFSVKLLVSHIIYVRDISLPVYVTFYYFFSLDTTLLPIISLTYKISLQHYYNDNFIVDITVRYSKKSFKHVIKRMN